MARTQPKPKQPHGSKIAGGPPPPTDDDAFKARRRPSDKSAKEAALDSTASPGLDDANK